MLSRFKRDDNPEQGDQPGGSPRDKALQHQRNAEALRHLAQMETKVAELLRACIVEQQELLSSWENMDPSDSLAEEVVALDATFQEAFRRTVEVIRQALLRERASIASARNDLKGR